MASGRGHSWRPASRDVSPSMDIMDNAGAITTYTYNHNGIRSSKTEAGTTTHFIIDENRDYAQVLEEDHSTLNRWVVFYAPILEKAFQKKKRLPGNRWRLDETYIKVKGQWLYYYRAVDKHGNTVDFLLTARRDRKAAYRYFAKAVKRNENLSLVNIDKSGANKSGIKQFNQDNNKRVKIRQCQYLNNVIEQDHRRIKGLSR